MIINPLQLDVLHWVLILFVTILILNLMMLGKYVTPNGRNVYVRGSIISTIFTVIFLIIIGMRLHRYDETKEKPTPDAVQLDTIR